MTVETDVDWDVMAMASLGRRILQDLEAGDMRSARHYARLRLAARRRASARGVVPADTGAVEVVDPSTCPACGR